jgi:hypothetical protein
MFFIDIYHQAISYLSLYNVANISSTVSLITAGIAKLPYEIIVKFITNQLIMKNLIRLLTLCTIAGFLFTACEGPMGLTGKDGKDANSSCITCHNTAKMDANQGAYALSKHFTGSTSSRNTKYCARCHTSTGFIEITNKPWAPGVLISATNDIPNATRISCETCHKHSAFDFSVDTIPMILRTTAPVSLNYNNNSKTTDFGAVNNLCVTCHQIRGKTSLVYSDTTLTPDVINASFNQLPYFPFAQTDDDALVSYLVGRSYSVHDGNQSNLFTGKNGYEYIGQTYTRTWKHSDFSCVDCHMNQYNPADSTGGHTFIPNEAVCTSCHSGADKLTPVITTIGAKLTELGNLLIARKVFKSGYSAVQTHDFNGKLYPTTQTPGDKFATSSSNNTVDPKTGLVIYGNNLVYAADANYATRIGRQWKYGELGAAYNYSYIKSESPSGTNYGVHNPVYALQLLQKSIDWLNTHPATK